MRQCQRRCSCAPVRPAHGPAAGAGASRGGGEGGVGEDHRRTSPSPTRSRAHLETLSDRLFKDLLKVVNATIALQEVLEQPLRLRADAQFKHNMASVEFWIEREGHKEDV